MPAFSQVPTPAGAPSPGTGYSGAAQGPAAWAILQTGLAVFAVFIIARCCLRRACSWWYGPAAELSRTESVAGLQAGLARSPPRWLMDEKSNETMTGLGGPAMGHDSLPATAPGKPTDSNNESTELPAFDPLEKSGTDSLPRQIVSRVPPVPPLTPPELSSAVFTIERAPHRQDSFIHQPNPDYMSSTSSLFQTDSDSSVRPRRRSYNRTLPVGIPVSQHSSSLSDADSADLMFSPSSYPPTGPMLPPPPPGPSRAESVTYGRRAVDVKGEIISVLDDEGAGWTRHTRVYGGEVCLACAASGKEHGGGFYGATVTPEEMR